MEQNIKTFAQRVCDYNIGAQNKKITGTFHAGNYIFKPFKYTGEYAKELIKILLKIEETG